MVVADPDEALIEAIAEALAAAYTSPFGARNPQWDWEKPDGPGNEYHLSVPMSERVTQSPYLIGTDAEGGRYIYHPAISEIARAAFAAMVEHLGLVEETARLYTGGSYRPQRRLVSRWVEVEP
jgi:hypothetical protein